MSARIGEKISACLLTFNNIQVIESTLLSILDQTVSGYEVIVSDDCSTDGTWERILEIAATDRRIRAIRTPKNLGMPGNANFAVSQCDRPYVALLHQDDFYRSDLLEKWAGLLEKYEDLGFVFNYYDDVTRENSERSYGHCFKDERLDGRWFLERFLLARWGCPVRGTAMIRRADWEKVGGMSEQFGPFADVDLWMRLSRISNVGYVPEPLIKVGKIRPDYYPEIYTQRTGWQWRRKVLVYEIFAANWRSHLRLNTVIGRLRWWEFRTRLSCETAKWLVYAMVRKRADIIAGSQESATEYDLWPLRVLRRAIQLAYR
jgi:glycosyltransferase involved in cell wall biosynthesis